jgi:hypothetical protein
VLSSLFCLSVSSLSLEELEVVEEESSSEQCVREVRSLGEGWFGGGLGKPSSSEEKCCMHRGLTFGRQFDSIKSAG